MDKDEQDRQGDARTGSGVGVGLPAPAAGRAIAQAYLGRLERSGDRRLTPDAAGP